MSRLQCFDSVAIGFLIHMALQVREVTNDDLSNELGHKERTISDLISYLETRTSDITPNYNILLGAGASVTSGVRTGQDLVSEWRKQIYELTSKLEFTTEEEAKKYLLTSQSHWYSESNEYSSLFEKKFDLPAQRRRFVEKEVSGKYPSIGYAYLASLVDSQDRYIDTIFTTNFDDLINEAFYQFSQNRPLVCAHDSSVSSLTLSSTRPKIIKLHGDFLFDDIKSTLRETESLETNIKNKFIEFSKEYGLIVVGYAGHDRSIMDVINHLIKSEEYFKNGIYWCIRKGDKVSSDLRKLLWKDGVYYVYIDGFDQLLAEVHHKLKGPLSIKENLSDSKHEKIIKNFSSNGFNLSESSNYIAKDLDSLEKHRNELDISHMIRELQNSDDLERGNISEHTFKTLLKVDTLIKSGNFLDAKNLADSSLESIDGISLKSNFIRKIIYSCQKLNDYDGAIKYCNKLIELDEYNHEHYLVKAETIESIEEKCNFIEENIERFKLSTRYLNFAVKRFMNGYFSQKVNFITLEKIKHLVDKSLALDPSLDNPAWEIKIDLIEHDESRNCKESNKNELINDIVNRANSTNPEHMRTLKISKKLIYDIDSNRF